jgi:hypothetical protein
MSDSDDDVAKECLNCRASFDGLKRCGKCRAVYFCNATCQREVWKAHCKVCVAREGAAAAPPRPGAPPGAPPVDEHENRAAASAAAKIEAYQKSQAAASAAKRVVGPANPPTAAAPVGPAPPPAQPAAPGGAADPTLSPEDAAKAKAIEEAIVKKEELRRINQEVLPEVDRLMRCGSFDDAIEMLEDGVVGRCKLTPPDPYVAERRLVSTLEPIK